MPKRLSDITHAYERSLQDLEGAQEELTRVADAARLKVETASKTHHAALDELILYLRAHPDQIVIAGDWGYRMDHGLVARYKVAWAHHEWVEEPAPVAKYRVPTNDLIVGSRPEATRSREGNCDPLAAAFEPRAEETALSSEGEAALDDVRATWDDTPHDAPPEEDEHEHPPFAAMIGIPDPRD